MYANKKTPFNWHKYVPLTDANWRIPSSMGLAYSYIRQDGILVSVKSQILGSLNLESLSGKLEANIKPAMVAKMSSRVIAEVSET